MKPYKLLACLVTLQFTVGLTLQAADSQSFREWTDDKGRQITARLLDMPDADSVKIERQDGRVFTISVKSFSQADRAYVRSFYAEKTGTPPVEEAAARSGPLTEADTPTWTLLSASGSQPASAYENTGLDTIIDQLNEHFTAKGTKTNTGAALQIRTEPSGLAYEIKVTGDLPSMNTALFLKQIARINHLTVKTDPSGMVVLVDPAIKAQSKPAIGSFFGVPVQ